jgi:predicted SnoaL-like aldol condensation-catalyzing enzyme
MGQRVQNAKGIYYDGIRDGNPLAAVAKYVGERYTQHSGGVKDGADGFVEFFQDFVKRNPVRDIEIVRSFEDGQYVFMHAYQSLNNGEFRYITADILDTDDDAKLIEHWDVITEVTDSSVSGHGQIDGPTEPTDLDKTEQNKALVRGFLTEVMKNGSYDRFTEFVSTESYIQHDPQLGDGIESLAFWVAERAAKGSPVSYREIHKVIGSGDLVASLSHVDLGDTEVAVMDLFRVSDDKIVEHWDVIEEIGSKETWVNSGKF